MTLFGMFMLVVVLAAFLSVPVEIVLGVLCIVWGVKLLTGLGSGSGNGQPAKRKKLKWVDEDE